MHIYVPKKGMTHFRSSLATRIFLAIAATSILIVAIMAMLVALSMRDGFARYLLRGELARFDALEQALVLSYDTDVPGWPELTATPNAWNEFVRLYFSPAEMLSNPPPSRPFGRPPFGKALFGTPPPGGPQGEDTFMIGDRLILLGPDGEQIAGSTDRSELFESRAICSDADCTDQNMLGYIGLNAPLSAQTASDTFFLRRQYSSLALSALIAILVSAAAAFVVARHVLTPIRQLEAGAKTMASGDYSTRINLKRNDELGQLIKHYNALAATLEKTDKAEREWISNTSHELQTPLATLRAQIEAVQDGIRNPDAETLAQMHAAMMRLSRLVEDVKILSHSREKGLMTAFQHDDLCEIVSTTAAVAQPLFDAKNIALQLDLPKVVPVACDRQRIGQVVENLLQNAARYTNAPGSVRVRVQMANDTVQMIVEDTPPAPRIEDLPKLFDRFFRAESSRSRAHGGSGLGLAVCKAIIDSHNGTITAGMSDKGGLCVTISLSKATT